MNFRFAATLLCISAFLCTSPSRADVTLPLVFSDDMVLQRDTPIHVWGTATPGEKVTVTLSGSRTQAEGNREGRWDAFLKPLSAGGPYTLTVAGKNTVALKNVLMGDVWLCSGQSNMELNLQRADGSPAVIAASTDPGLRLFRVHQNPLDAPTDTLRGPASWQTASPETTGKFSAVAYFFGRALRKAHPNVPIGLVGSYVGGTPGQGWTREAALSANPVLRQHYLDPYPAQKADHERQMKEYETALARAKAEGKKEPQKPYSFWRYSSLYNGMIAPLTPFSLRGVVWYQGESNAKDPVGYRALLPAMIRDWRAQWKQADLPFLLVQLPPFGKASANETSWAQIRETQLQAAQNLPQVAVVVTTDVGNPADIHPTNKLPVGERLALAARKLVYGEKGMVASGPVYKSMKMEGGVARLTFDSVGDGLEARGGIVSYQPVSERVLSGFTIAGKDGVFVPAQAKIVGKETVEVSAPEVKIPVAVRYGFINTPALNLWNKNGLPASPFRTDSAL